METREYSLRHLANFLTSSLGADVANASLYIQLQMTSRIADSRVYVSSRRQTIPTPVHARNDWKCGLLVARMKCLSRYEARFHLSSVAAGD